MSDTAPAKKMLVLFTSPDRAEGIAGDLAEARGERGSIWFWWQVLATTVALWGDTFTRAPLASLGLAAAGCWLFASSALGGVVAISLFPGHLGSAVSWIVLSLLWWGGALCTGVLLVSMAPTRGMAMCVVLSVAIEALLIASGLTVFQPEVLRTPSVVFYSIAALAPVPLLIGGATVRLRLIANSSYSLEQTK